MFYSAYNRLFWGLLLVFLDIRIMTFDIFPDFIGFIMAFAALGQLAGQHEYFGRARPFAFMLIFFSLADLIQLPGSNLVETPLSDQSLVVLIMGQIFIILNLFMVFWICKGIYTLAQARELYDLEARAKNRWSFFLGISVVILFTTPFMLNTPEDWRIILIALIIPGFVSALFIMGLIRRAGRELGEIEQNNC